jgi:hypothetical protein
VSDNRQRDPLREGLAGFDVGLAGLAQGLMMTREQNLKRDAEARRDAAGLVESATTQLGRLAALPQSPERDDAMGQLGALLTQAQGVQAAPKGQAWGPFQELMTGAGPAQTVGAASGMATAGERQVTVDVEAVRNNDADVRSLDGLMGTGAFNFADPLADMTLQRVLLLAESLADAPVSPNMEARRDRLVGMAQSILGQLSASDRAAMMQDLNLRNLTATVRSAEAAADTAEVMTDQARALLTRQNYDNASAALSLQVQSATAPYAIEMARLETLFAEGRLTDQQLGQELQRVTIQLAGETYNQALETTKAMKFDGEMTRTRWWEETGLIDPNSAEAQALIATKYRGNAEAFALESAARFRAYTGRRLQEDRMRELTIAGMGIQNDTATLAYREGKLRLGYAEYQIAREQRLNALGDQTSVHTLVYAAMDNGDVNMLRAILADMEDPTSDRGRQYLAAGLTVAGMKQSLARAQMSDDFTRRSLEFAHAELAGNLALLSTAQGAQRMALAQEVLAGAAQMIAPEHIDGWWASLDVTMQEALGGEAALPNLRRNARVMALLSSEPLKADAMQRVGTLLDTMPTTPEGRQAVADQVVALLTSPEVEDLFGADWVQAYATGIGEMLARASTQWEWAIAKQSLDMDLGRSQVVLNHAQAGYYNRMPQAHATAAGGVGESLAPLRQLWSSVIDGARATAAGILEEMKDKLCLTTEGSVGGQGNLVPGQNADRDDCVALASAHSAATIQAESATRELEALAQAATFGTFGTYSLTGAPTAVAEEPPAADMNLPAPLPEPQEPELPPLPQVPRSEGFPGIMEGIAAGVSGAATGIAGAATNFTRWLSGNPAPPALSAALRQEGVAEADLRALVGADAGGTNRGTSIGQVWQSSDRVGQLAIERSVGETLGVDPSAARRLLQALFGGR